MVFISKISEKYKIMREMAKKRDYAQDCAKLYIARL